VDPILEIPFHGGIDETTRDELVDAARTFRVKENVRQSDRGGASKRYGFTAQTLSRLDATTRSAGRKLIALDSVIGVIDGSLLDTYSATAAVNVSHGRVPEASYSVQPVPGHTASTVALCDVAHLSGYVAVAQLDSTDIVVAVSDVAGNVLRAPEIVYSGLAESFAVLATYSTYFILIVSDGNSVNVPAYYLDTSTAATITTGWVSIGNVATDKTTSGGGAAFALSAQSLSDRVAFTYVNDSGGTSQVTVKTITIAGVSETATINTSSVKPTTIAAEGSNADTLWVAWNETTSVKLIGLTGNDLATTKATTSTLLTLNEATPPAIGIVSSSTAGKGRIVATDGAADRLHFRGFQTSGGAVAADGSQNTVPNVMLGSRPFREGTRYYALFADCPGTTGNFQKVAILCDFTADQTWIRPVANVEPSYANFGALQSCHVESLGTSQHLTVLAIERTSSSRGVSLITFDFADVERWQHVSHNGQQFLGGGMLATIAGPRVSEAGFLLRPARPSAAGSGAGSGPDGTYRYVQTFEEVDTAGVWTISGVSDPSDSVSVTNKTINVTWRPLGITARQQIGDGTHVRVRLWRTKDGGEPPYYLLMTLRNNTLGIAATATYADSTADSSLGSSALLRGDGNLPATNGSAQDRRAPPGLKHLVSYNGMLVGARGSVLWHSGQSVDGEGVWFNPLFQVPIPGDGDVKTLATLDGGLYAFKRREVYALAGEAPSDNGATGGLGLPRRLAVDIGASQAPTCVTSLGVFFVSDRGIEVLTRGQTVEYIGERIKTTFAAYPVVTAMTYDPNADAVIVELAASTANGAVSGDGRTLVYDLRGKVWDSIDRRKNQAGTADTPAQDGAVVWNGSAWRYAWLGADGRVYIEDHTTYLDPGSAWVTMKITTGRVHIAGLQGEQAVERVLALGEWYTGHDLTMGIAHDYAAAASETQTWTASQLASLSPLWLDRGLTRHTGQALRVTLSDATPSSGSVGTGKGGTWVCLTFSGTPHRGPKRTTSAQRGGT